MAGGKRALGAAPSPAKAKKTRVESPSKPQGDPVPAWPGLFAALCAVVREATRDGTKLTKTEAVVRALERTPWKGFAMNTTPERIVVGRACRNVDYAFAGAASRPPDAPPDISLADVRPSARVAAAGGSDAADAASLSRRIEEFAPEDWFDTLSKEGIVLLPGVVPRAACARALQLFAADHTARGPAAFHTTRLTESKGNGRNGVYCYWHPELAEGLRTALHGALSRAHEAQGPSGERLAPLGEGGARSQCILLAYGEGGENFAHKDQGVCAYQALALLSEPGEDFRGGRLYVVEEGDPLRRTAVDFQGAGDVAVFRAQHAAGEADRALRHGMERVTWGKRFGLGVTFNNRP